MKMFKKYAWIVALLAALSMLFFACGSPGGDDDGDGDGDGDFDYNDAPDFELSWFLEDLELEVGDRFTMPTNTAAKAAFWGALFSEAAQGSNSAYYVEIIETEDGGLGWEIFTGTDPWGAGVDLTYPGFLFVAGDKIRITGKATDANWYVGTGENFGTPLAVLSTEADQEFDEEFVLTAAQVNAIKTTNDPFAIRIGNKGTTPGVNASNAGTNKKIQIYSIEIWRPTDAEVEYAAVTGITGVPKTLYATDLPYTLAGEVAPDYAEEQDIVWTIKNARETGAEIEEEDGIYVLTATTGGDIVITGTVINGTDVDEDYIEDFEITIIMEAPPALTLTVAGDEVIADVIGIGSEVTFNEDLTGFTVESTTGSGNYGAFYAQFKVDLGDGKSLSDFGTVKVKYQAVSGDVGWKTLSLLASADELTGSVNSSYAGMTVSSYNYSNDGLTAMDIDFLISASDTKVTALDGESVLYFVVYLHASGANGGDPTTYTISDIVFAPVKYEAVTNIAVPPGMLTGFVGDEVALSATNITPANATNQDIVWSVKDPSDGDVTLTDGNKFTPSVPGTYTATATIENGSTESTPYTQDFEIVIAAEAAPPVLELELDLDDLEDNLDQDDQPQNQQRLWDLSSITGGLDAFKASKYLVLVCEGDGDGDNENGFGGIQIVLKDWANTAINGDFMTVPRGDGIINYLVIDLTTLSGYEAAIAKDYGMILIQYFGGKPAEEALGLTAAYLVSGDLIKPDGAEDIGTYGFVTTEDITEDFLP